VNRVGTLGQGGITSKHLGGKLADTELDIDVLSLLLIEAVDVVGSIDLCDEELKVVIVSQGREWRSALE